MGRIYSARSGKSETKRKGPPRRNDTRTAERSGQGGTKKDDEKVKKTNTRGGDERGKKIKAKCRREEKGKMRIRKK